MYRKRSAETIFCREEVKIWKNGNKWAVTIKEEYEGKKTQIESKYKKRMEGRKASSPDCYMQRIKTATLMGMKYRHCHLQSCCMFADVDGKQWTDTWQGS